MEIGPHEGPIFFGKYFSNPDYPLIDGKAVNHPGSAKKAIGKTMAFPPLAKYINQEGPGDFTLKQDL